MASRDRERVRFSEITAAYSHKRRIPNVPSLQRYSHSTLYRQPPYNPPLFKHTTTTHTQPPPNPPLTTHPTAIYQPERENSNEQWTIVTRRRRYQPISKRDNNRLRPSTGAWGGHRGESRHLWWRGPREPPPSEYGHLISLFIEGIPNKTSIVDLRRIFERHGKVMDIYISGKKRMNSVTSFGFVRYGSLEEATNVMEKLNGIKLHGSILKVNLAKFRKGGVPVHSNKQQTRVERVASHGVKYPAHRDHRKYEEVVIGNTKNPSPPTEKASRKETNSFKLRLIENEILKERMKVAAIIEVEKESDMEPAVETIKGMNIYAVDLSHLSPFKFVVFFEDESKLLEALKETSPLAMAFPNVRRWTEKEKFLERCVWLECRGLDPRCWSYGNLKMIGRSWGTVLEIENVFNGMNSITAARMLIKTDSLNKIQGSVEVEWKNGSCVVWVNEIIRDEYMVKHGPTCEDEEQGDSVSNSDASDEDVEIQNLIHNDNGEKEHNDNGDMEMDINGDKEDSEGERRNQERNETHEETLLDVVQTVNVLLEKNSGQNGELQNQGFETNECNCGSSTFEVTTAIKDTNDHCMRSVNVIHENFAQQETLRQEVGDDQTWVDRLNKNVVGQPSSDWFDPISSIECILPLPITVEARKETISQKKRRGRPQRMAQSLPEPLYVPSTPPNSNMEARETWNTVKLIGVKSRNEQAVVSAIRRSKRLLVMEETSH
ncbi:unnamed protein product [Amaranthus hypochondriacus]